MATDSSVFLFFFSLTGKIMDLIITSFISIPIVSQISVIICDGVYKCSLIYGCVVKYLMQNHGSINNLLSAMCVIACMT